MKKTKLKEQNTVNALEGENMSLTANTQTDVKLNNQRLIIEYLLNHGPTSRADISKAVSSSKPTISKNVEDLIHNNLVVELGKADNSLGKKAVLIDLNKNFAYVLAVDLSKRSIRISINNLRGEVCAQARYLDDTTETISEMIDHMLIQADVPQSAIQMVVIAYPGIVTKDGKFYFSNIKEKEQLMQKLYDELKEKVTCPIIVKNDINLAIVAEKAYNGDLKTENLLYISFEIGVGSGIFLNGKLYEGDRQAAGEIGFTIPAQERANKYSSLEKFVTMDAILSKYFELTGDAISISAFDHKIETGDVAALKIYEDVVETISVTVTNITIVLDIEEVILSGAVMTMRSTMYQDIEKRISEISPFITKVRLSKLENPSLRGCVYTGTQELINHLIVR